ncbi:MAG: FAD-dependent oxidoreductase [Myxococcales bacterium]|nr:FAD-dependent oxidoreductase [Myxococcales bacterium]MCB9575596.1 FAD-dependent oxidoreductase [Polyangiaceae bacterium]
MRDADVVVVGAGIAGLVAARRLAAAGKSVVVLEARDRVGGRTWSGQLEGAEVDYGGEWIGAGQPRMYALLKELGLSTFPTFDTGKKILEMRGRISTYSGTIPWMAPWKLAQMQAAIWSIDALARRLDPVEPWSHPRAAAWDATTLDAMRRRLMWSADARAAMDAAMRTIFGAESGELSLFHALAYVRSAGSLEKLISTEGGFQHDRIVGGAQAVSLALAKELRVVLEAPVTSIAQDGDGVIVKSVGGEVRASRVVVAVPVPLGARIAFSPRLPALREQLTQRAPMGAAVKCFARYERPFWRERGLSGEAASGDGPISVTFDQSSADGSAACLLAFVGGAPARSWHRIDSAERRRLILSKLARYFGDEAKRPMAYVETDWCTEQYSGGGPIALFPPGSLSVHGAALRAPVGRIHWAGSETARACMGFMEGAVESGERAAEEVRVA